MGVIDKIMNVMHLNTEDDDFDQDDFDDMIDEPVNPARPVKERIEKPERHSDEKKQTPVVQREKTVVKTQPNITSFKSSKKQQGQGMEICVIKPTSFDEARDITETLLSGRAVMLNLEGLNLDIAQRIIDFASGSTFAISGNLQKITNCIFVITPANIDVSGDFQEMLGAIEFGNNLNM